MHSELHIHTEYSLLDGFSHPKEYLDRAKELGLKAIAVTEHGNQYSWVYFDKLKKDYPDIKMIYGVELYEAFDIDIKDKDSKYFHLIALAKNEKGRIALNEIITQSNFKGFYYKPRVDLNMLKPYANDLIISSGCLASKLARESDYNKCVEYVKEYKSIFPNFFLELQSHKSDDQIEYNKKIIKLAKDTNTEYIITTDSHVARKEDLYYQARHVQIAHDSDTLSESYEGCYMQSDEEIHSTLDSQIGEIAVNIGLNNTNKIADMIEDINMPFQEPQLPTFPLPDGFKDNYEYILYLINKGWKERNIDSMTEEEIKIRKERVDYEMSVIHQMGFDGYFLIVWDFINFCKHENIPIGAGRGCCLGHTLIQTKDSLKQIKDVKKNDYVLTSDGKWNKVLKTFEYDINEPMIEFKYKRQGSSYKKYTSTYTLDHKILVNKNKNIQYVKASELNVGDLLCCPKIKPNNNTKEIIYDLNDYNVFGYEYDNNYIYEKIQSNKPYIYSPTWLYSNNIVTKTFAKKIGNGWRPSNKRGDANIKSLLNNTPFKTLDDYQKYFEKHSYNIKKIPRFVKMNSLLNTFVAMMYGDGFTYTDTGLGLAINNTTKNKYNRYVFYKVANRFNLQVYENKSKNTNLIQLYINSKILNNWFSNEFFKSKKNKEKVFNKILLEQKQSYLKCLYNGLLRTDGSISEGRIRFDNTSLSLINAFKILNNYLGFAPMSLDVRLEHTDSRGYNCKESYKLTRSKNKDISEDNNYWFLPITEIIKKPLKKEKVYDICVENNHSYLNNNIIAHNSGAGSFVCYLLGITNLDPIKYNLIFERFLNIERISMPDIDTDVTKRDKIINYLINKYGEERVCQIINFSYITPVVSIKDTAKVLGIPYKMADKISKRFSYETFEECMKNNPNIYNDFKSKTDEEFNNKLKELFDIASHISGRVKNASIHAGGVGIVDSKITDYMGMKLGSKNEHVIQVDKRVIEEIGIIKFDILGVATLDILSEVKKDVGLSDWDIDINNPKFYNDKLSFDLLCSGETDGVFQVSSYEMKSLLKRLKPRNIEELSALIALFRPDCMQFIDHYINRKNGTEPIEYIHEDMKPILDKTYGICLYQEEVLEIVRKFGGRTYGGADKYRKAIGKKNIQLVKEESEKLYKEILSQNYDEKVARNISDEMSSKGNYCFNKSHSVAYAVLCLQTAYLKAHYPSYFYKALLNANRDDNGKINKFIVDAQNFNVKILPPNINKSQGGFSVYNGSILFGFEAIRGIGKSVSDLIIEERNKNGKFRNLNDLISRLNLGESQIIALIKAGALPTKNKRKMIIDYAKKLYKPSEYKDVKSLPTLNKLKEEWNIDIDTIKSKEERLKIYNSLRKQKHEVLQKQKYNKFKEDFTNKYLQDERMWEFSTLSVFLNNNPFTKYYDVLKSFDDVEEGDSCVLVGVVSKVVKKKDKNKKQFAYISMYSAMGIIEITCWSSQFAIYQDIIKKDNVLAILCDKKENKAFVKKIKTFEQWKHDISKNV